MNQTQFTIYPIRMGKIYIIGIGLRMRLMMDLTDLTLFGQMVELQKPQVMAFTLGKSVIILTADRAPILLIFSFLQQQIMLDSSLSNQNK